MFDRNTRKVLAFSSDGRANGVKKVDEKMCIRDRYDVETLNAVRAALDTLPGGRDSLMDGEPWQGGGSQLHRYEANKATLAMLNDRIGKMCIRDRPSAARRSTKNCPNKPEVLPCPSRKARNPSF